MEGDLGWCCSSGSNNWDLHAVVRFGCSGGGSVPTPSAVSDDDFSWLPTPSVSEDPYSGVLPQAQQHTDQLVMEDAASQSLLADPAVDDLCLQAFFASPKPTSPAGNEAPPQRSPADGPPAKPRSSARVDGGKQTRSKRKSKKSQVKKEAMRVPAGGPPADPWAWRKYGQKPIKGSPYPRGYYRCSTDKECKARKQVERCPADAATLIVTYTGDHSHPVPLHRNSLAGTTRNKTRSLSPSSTAGNKLSKPLAALSASATDTKSQDSPSASTGLSPGTPLRSLSLGGEYNNEEDDDTIPVSLLLDGTEMETEDDVLLFLSPEEPAMDPANNGSGCECEDKPPPPTASTSRRAGGTAVMNVGEEKFSVSGLSAWDSVGEAASAASSRG
ncbi:hypothetical protein BS78_10G142800 [Paspalum vaginatum]|nr:hypothetical protein BS78_10G142800 [Paspalum vaginatum]KAJ1259293.1 hypothetical protein BS78_10G142800 [Paspalum vaginatum]